MQSARAKFVNSRGNFQQTGELSSFFVDKKLDQNFNRSAGLAWKNLFNSTIYNSLAIRNIYILHVRQCYNLIPRLLVRGSKNPGGAVHVTPKIYLPKGVWAKCQITYASTFGFCTSIARSECSV